MRIASASLLERRNHIQDGQRKKYFSEDVLNLGNLVDP